MIEAALEGATTPVTALTFAELVSALRETIGAHGGTHAILLVEPNDFDGLRESLGFEQAGALIDRFTLQIRALLGARARVLRFGDSALCICLPRVLNTGHAVLAAERVRRCVAESTADLVGLKHLPRIGIALHPRDGDDPQLLLRAAQLASAMARRRSEAVLVFDHNWSETFLAQSQLGDSIGPALENGRLSLHYQPKVRISDGAVLGVDALMRWLDGTRIVATPDLFVPLAEELGLGSELAWESLTQGMRLSQSLGGLPVAVNITPMCLHQKEFVEMVECAVRAWDALPGALTLELTEGALVADFMEARARLSHLRKLGIRVSIDDFGTGYSSLSYFKSIPADELKIDKSFILRMVEDAADQRLVEAIIGLAHQFDLEVVAEGVETHACLDMLGTLSCDFAQGFLFAQAMDEDRLRAWLHERAQLGSAKSV